MAPRITFRSAGQAAPGERNGARSMQVGNYNRGLVLEAIRLNPGISRAQVVGSTGLTSATVSSIVRALIDEGLVEEGDLRASTGGKRPTSLHVRRGASFALGLHFDPAVVFAVLIDLDGTIVEHSRTPLREPRTPRRVLDRLARAAQDVLTRAQVDPGKLVGVGVASPGPFDEARRTILDSPHFDGWGDVPMAAILESRLDLPVLIENDANAAAVGEKWLGVAREVPNFLYVYFGTGIGGAIFLDHELYRGCSGYAGALGHITVDPGGGRCSCGSHGCLGTICSPRAIVEAARRLTPQGRAGLALSDTGDDIDEDHRAIVQAAARGDRAAREVLVPSAMALSRAISTAVNVLDVDHVVLGGHAIGGVQDLYSDVLTQTIAGQTPAGRRRRMQVITSRSDDLAGAIGGASLLFHETYTPHQLSYRNRLAHG